MCKRTPRTNRASLTHKCREFPCKEANREIKMKSIAHFMLSFVNSNEFGNGKLRNQIHTSLNLSMIGDKTSDSQV